MRPPVAGRPRAFALVLLLAATPSCYQDSLYDSLLAEQEALATSTGGTPSTSAGTTTEGGSEGSPASSGTSAVSGPEGARLDLGSPLEPLDPPPEIFEFKATPGKLDAAGPLLLDLEVSASVQEIELRHIVVVGELESEGATTHHTPENFPLHRALVSAEENGTHLYTVIARAGEGQDEARATVEVKVNLPDTGQEVWSWESDDDASRILGIVPLEGGAVVAGYIVHEGAPYPQITRLSNTGAVLWEADTNNGDEPLFDAPGYASALTIRPDGDIIVVGNRYKNGDSSEQAMWMRRLSLDGDIAVGWGDDGVTGERAYAVTSDDSGQIVVAGDFQTAEMKPHHDLRVWAYTSAGSGRWSETWTRPGVTYDRDEQAHAALVLPGGDIIIAGHTSQDVFDLPSLNQGLLLRFDANGDVDSSPWIDQHPDHHTSQVHALTRNAKGDIFLGGRSTLAPDQTPTATVWRLDDDLQTQLWSRHLPGADPDTAAESLQLTANDDLVIGSTRHNQFRVTIARPVGAGPLLWDQPLHLAGGPDQLHDLRLDDYDYIYIAGQATVGTKHRAYARRISP